jgi:hypothetical protein
MFVWVRCLRGRVPAAPLDGTTTETPLTPWTPT